MVVCTLSSVARPPSPGSPRASGSGASRPAGRSFCPRGPTARLLAFLVAAALSARPAPAAPPLSDGGLAYSHASGVSVNPLGLIDQLELELWQRLFAPGDSALLANNAASAALSLRLTPAFARLGAALKLRPLNIFKFEVRAEGIGYFGTFDALQPLDSPRADHSDAALAAGGDAGRHRAALGAQLTLESELRGRVGPLVLRSRLRAAWASADIPAHAPVYYEPYNDLLLPRSGWFFTHDADALLLLGPHLTVGVRHSWVHVRYPASAYPAGEPHTTTATPQQRLGPVFAWRFFDDPGAAFDQPTLFVLAQWYLVHPSRAGQEVSQVLPYVGLAFAFAGELP